MSTGIKKYTPKQTFALQDYGEATVKLSPDEENTYLYITQPLYEFTSAFGIELSALIKISNIDIKLVFPFQIYITKESIFLFVNYPDGTKEQYTPLSDNPNQYECQESYNKIEKVQEKLQLKVSNDDVYVFVLNTQTNHYELKNIFVNSANNSITNLIKTNNIVKIMNSANQDSVMMQTNENKTIITIKRDNKTIKIYQFEQTATSMEIKYLNQYNEEKTNTYLKETIQLTRAKVQISRQKENLNFTYDFNINSQGKIESFVDYLKNSTSFTYEANENITNIDIYPVGNYPQHYKLYYNTLEQITHIFDLKNKTFITYTYNEKRDLIQQSLPFYYETINKNLNYIKKDVTHSNYETIYKNMIGHKNDVISFFVKLTQVNVIKVSLCIYYYKTDATKKLVTQEIKAMDDNTCPYFIISCIMPENYTHVSISVIPRIEDENFQPQVYLFKANLLQKYNYNNDGIIDSILIQNVIQNKTIINKKVVNDEQYTYEYDGNYLIKIKSFDGRYITLNYDSNHNISAISLYYVNEDNLIYEQNYEYDINHQLILSKNPKEKNASFENQYYFNSTLKSSKWTINDNTYQSVEYIYNNNQPFLQEISFYNQKETTNSTSNRYFSYINEAVYQINGDSEFNFDNNSNNDLKSIAYYKQNYISYQYYNKNEKTTSLIYSVRYGNEPYSFYFNYNEALSQLSSISRSENEQEAQQAVIYRFFYNSKDQLAQINNYSDSFEELPSSQVSTNFYYTEEDLLYKINNIIGEESVAVFANNTIIESKNNSLVLNYSSKVNISEESLVNELRNPQKNIKVCNFNTIPSITNSPFIAYNYAQNGNFNNQEENQTMNAIYYDGNSCFCIDKIDNSEILSPALHIQTINGIKSALLSDLKDNVITPTKNFTKFNFNFYYSFDNKNTPFYENLFSLSFLCSFKTISSYKTILMCLSEQEPLQIVKQNTENLICITFQKINNQEVKFSLFKASMTLTNTEGYQNIPDLSLNEEVCSLSFKINENLGYMVALTVNSNTKQAILFINGKTQTAKMDTPQFYSKGRKGLIFGLRTWRSQEEVDFLKFLSSNFESEFYISNILIPYRKWMSEEELLDIYYRYIQISTHRNTYQYLKNTKTFFHKTFLRNMSYISLNQTIISNDNLKPDINIALSSLQAENSNFVYDYQIEKYVYQSGNEILAYSNIIKNNTKSFTITFKIKRVNVYHNLDISNPEKFNILALLDQQKTVLQLYGDEKGHIEVHLNNQKTILNQLLANDKYQNLRIKINNNQLSIYLDQICLYENAIQSSFTVENLKLSLGYNYFVFSFDKVKYRYSDLYIIQEEALDSSLNQLELMNTLIQNEYDLFSNIAQYCILKNNQIILKNHLNIDYNKNQITSNDITISNQLYNFIYGYNDDQLLSTISMEFYNNYNFISYDYDEKNQIINETKKNNKNTIQQIDYKYDKFGNIIKLIKNNQIELFDYDNKQRLIKARGNDITYDEQLPLFPIQIGDMQLKWEGNRLIQTKLNENTFTYKYNESNLRILKIANQKIHYYFYNGNLLIYEIIQNTNDTTNQKDEIHYIYDDNQRLFAIIYNEKIYYYIKDALNNIIGLIDEEENIVCKYEYSAYGEVTIYNADGSIDSSKSSIGYLNPFRFKGYYFDVETQLYYCISRYYSPELCRWISPDSIEYLDPQSINGLNLYCYCGNNPIMYSDPSGHIAISALLLGMAIGFGVGFAIGGGFEIGKQIYANGWNPGDWDWGQIGLSALGGGVAGAISSISLGTGLVGYLSAFAFGGIGSALGGWISGSVTSWETAGMAFLIGGTANVLGKGVTDIINKIKVGKNISVVANKANKIASMSAKKKSLAIWEMIGMDNFSRNAYKSWGYDQILELLMTEANNQLFINSANGLTRYIVYSALISSLGSGWY